MPSRGKITAVIGSTLGAVKVDLSAEEVACELRPRG